MTGIGPITVPTAGAVTAPDMFPLVLPSAESKTLRDHGPISNISLPGGRGTMLVNGMDPMRHIQDDDIYRTGLLAPVAALAATPTGAQATATLTVTANFSLTSASLIYLGTSGYNNVTFVTSLVYVPGLRSSHQVLVDQSGADDAAKRQNTLDNLVALINGESGEGTTYRNATSGAFSSTQPMTAARSGDVVTVTADAYGVVGNSYIMTEVTDPAGNFGVTAWSGGTAGTGTGPGTGYYQYRYGYYRSADRAYSGVSPLDDVSHGDSTAISLASIADPAVDDDIDYKRWYRTAPSGVEFYKGVDIEAADTTDSDTLSNSDLILHNAYDADTARLYAEGMIERVRHIVEYKGRWVGGGFISAADYSIGTAAVTVDSKEVTITTGLPTTEMEHMTFTVTASTQDDAIEYTIIWVDEANQKIYLDRDYEGSTNGTATYRIRDSRDPFTLYYSVPLLPNQSTGNMNISGVQSPDGEGITGLYPMWESVVVFTKTGIWRLTGEDAETFRLTHEYEGVGCVAGKSIVGVDGILYWLGSDGIYAWTGQGEPFKASSPPDSVSGISRTIARINRRMDQGAIVHYDPESRLLRWFVPLDGAWTNDHALVLDLQSKTWSLDTAPDVTCCTTVVDAGGALRTLAGDAYGCVWELDVSNSDGAFGFEPVGTIAAGSTLGSFTVDSAVLPTTGDGLTGVPCTIISASTGEFVQARVASNTSSVVTLQTYLDAAPADGDTVVFGGIHQKLKSGWFSLGEQQAWKIWEAVRVCSARDTDGVYYVSGGSDGTAPAVVNATGQDLTDADGEQHIWYRDNANRFQIRLDAIEPGCDPSFQSMQLWLRTRDA